MDDYACIDAGDGARLERFGSRVVVRPHAGATARRRAPDRWSAADLRFDRERGWSGVGVDATSDWVVRLEGIAFELRPTDAGQVGVFPEHATLLSWIRDRLLVRHADQPDVLNLFAYTGLATLALAQAGAAVAHVDAARPSVTWARGNAALNRLDDRPIRWLVDDARDFVARESRRGRRYDGVVLDPPTYGHGSTGRAWRLSTDLEPLLAAIRDVLDPDGFILLTAHAQAMDADHLGDLLRTIVDRVEVGQLMLTAESGAVLELGLFARSRGAS